MTTILQISDLEEGDIVFLLDITYNGIQYQFSTSKIDLEDLARNTITRYNGGLEDPTIKRKSEILGRDLSGDSIPTQLVFEDVDWMREWRFGRIFDQSLCVFSMIIAKNGKTKFTVQDKVLLFRGRSDGSTFAEPKKPIGWIAFSVKNDVSIQKVKIVPIWHRLSSAEFPNIHPRAEGAIVPVVLGKPGGFPVGYNDTLQVFDRLEATPAYMYYFDVNPKFIVSYNVIEATELRIWDSLGGNFVNPVQTALDSQGRIYSFVEYVFQGPLFNIEDNNFNPFRDENQEYWAQWSEYGGAQLNEFQDGVLTGAGDICLHYLQLSGLEYDYDEWQGLRKLLNQYKFAGYINDLDADAWAWVVDSVIKYLPIEAVNAGRGIKPMINLYSYPSDVLPQHYLSDGGDFQITSGLQQLDADPVNTVQVRYAWEGVSNKFKSRVTIQGDLDPTKQSSIRYVTPLAAASFQRFGRREHVVELQNCYDFNTANRIANDILKTRGMGAYGIDVVAHSKYGYIQLGDVISLTSEHVGLKDFKCQVISKTWRQNQWLFVIYLESNPLVNPLDGLET